MNLRNLILFGIAGILLSSCNKNRLYENHIDPSGNLEWNKSEIVSFDIEIIDTSIKYDVYLALRFANGFAYSFCDVVVREISPTGIEKEYPFTFKTHDGNGYMGEIAGDIIDLEELWRKDYSFSETGIYQYEIRHNMEKDKIHMVMEVGMIVDKVMPQ